MMARRGIIALEARSRAGWPSRVAAALLSVCLGFDSGCATQDRKLAHADDHVPPANIAVVVTQQPPEITFEGFARSKVVGASSLGLPVLFACLAQCAGAGPFCVYFAPIIAGVCAAQVAVAGGVGAAMAPSAEAVRDSEAAWSNAIASNSMQATLRDQIIASATAQGASLVPITVDPDDRAAAVRNYTAVAPQGVNAVLEVGVTKAGIRKAGVGSALHAFVQARVRLLGTGDNAEISSSDYLFEGEQLTFDEWSSDRGDRLARNLVRGYQQLGGEIFDRVFLLYPFPGRGPHRLGMLTQAFGLAPVDAPLAETTVAPLQPTLRWERFPRDADLRAAPEEMARVRNVRYDLMIARQENAAPVEIVYRRDKLMEPSHAVETPLIPATHYYWTVRASFDIDGRHRVTEWSSTACCRGFAVPAPSDASYEFKTP
jgi:hypothetical protein